MRAAFIKLSALSKIFRNCKGFEKSQFYKINKELRCSLISRGFATNRYLHDTSNPFPCFLPMISHDDHPPYLKKNAELLWTMCVLVPIVYTHLILSFKPDVCSQLTIPFLVKSSPLKKSRPGMTSSVRPSKQPSRLIKSGRLLANLGAQTTQYTIITNLLRENSAFF